MVPKVVGFDVWWQALISCFEVYGYASAYPCYAQHFVASTLHVSSA